MKVVLAACLLSGLVSACDEAADDGTLTVAVAFYPIEEVVRRVGGPDVEVVPLVPRGQEAHEFEPTAKQAARLEDADVIFYLGGDFQPNLQRVIAALPGSVRRVDLLQGLTLLDGDDGIDPHVWLDPRNMQAMAQVVADVLGSAGAPYIEELADLDQEFAAGLATCDAPVLITTHEAFAYLAEAYGLTYFAIAGVSPADEPSAKDVEAIAEFAQTRHVTTIFYEANLPSDLADTVAQEIGARTAPLATAESPTDNQLGAGESYVTMMRDNLEALRAGMGCA